MNPGKEPGGFCCVAMPLNTEPGEIGSVPPVSFPIAPGTPPEPIPLPWPTGGGVVVVGGGGGGGTDVSDVGGTVVSDVGGSTGGVSDGGESTGGVSVDGGGGSTASAMPAGAASTTAQAPSGVCRK